MTTADFTEEELSLLSPAERAGLLDPNLVDGELDEGELEEGEGGDTGETAAEDTPEAEAADEGAASAETGDEYEDTPAHADPAQAEPVVADTPDESADVVPAAPAYTLPPADIDDQIEAAKAEKAALRKRFRDEGDINEDEYDAALDQLQEKLTDLKLTREMGVRSYTTQRDNWFKDTVAGFLGEHSEYSKDKIRHGALNDCVKELQETTFAGNVFDPQILVLAHQQVQRSMGVLPAAKPAKANTPARPQREIPPNIGGLPTAGDEDMTDTGNFAYLDRLANKDPLKFEQELAKMTDSARDQYLAAN